MPRRLRAASELTVGAVLPPPAASPSPPGQSRIRAGGRAGPTSQSGYSGMNITRPAVPFQPCEDFGHPSLRLTAACLLLRLLAIPAHWQWSVPEQGRPSHPLHAREHASSPHRQPAPLHRPARPRPLTQLAAQTTHQKRACQARPPWPRPGPPAAASMGPAAFHALGDRGAPAPLTPYVAGH